MIVIYKQGTEESPTYLIIPLRDKEVNMSLKVITDGFHNKAFSDCGSVDEAEKNCWVTFCKEQNITCLTIEEN